MATSGPDKSASPGGDKAGKAPTTGATPRKKSTQLGDFKLLRKLGQGGMGEVYLANQCSLDRKVAVKVLSRELAKKPGLIERFTREARAMGKIDHPNAVKVYVAESDKGLHYVAIEYIDGKSMQDWMDKLGKLSVGDSLNIVLACADALKHAHDMNLIHRDIKPDNILLTKNGVVKVADFGLAKVIDDDEMSMTQTGTGLGTPLYMPPEQARNAKHVDQRTDIYALGCTLYYFLTGKLPFRGDSLVALIAAKETGKFTSARQLNRDVPDKLDLMIDKMMTKSPTSRYQQCDELIRDLGSLGLQSQSLSFLGSDAEPTARRTPALRAESVAVAPTVLAGELVSSAEDAERTQAKTLAETKGDDSWFIRHTNVKGETAVSKMTTTQIRTGLKGNVLDVKAQARRASAQGEFLPLSQFPEFEALMKRRLVKAQADARAGHMKDVYQKLDKEERTRKRWRWLKNLTEGALGWFGFVIYLAVVAAVLYGLYWVVRFLVFPFLSDSLNLS